MTELPDIGWLWTGPATLLAAVPPVTWLLFSAQHPLPAALSFMLLAPVFAKYGDCRAPCGYGLAFWAFAGVALLLGHDGLADTSAVIGYWMFSAGVLALLARELAGWPARGAGTHAR